MKTYIITLCILLTSMLAEAQIPISVSISDECDQNGIIEGFQNGHQWIDLGLSVNWATCNIGATTPEGYGGYYAWGETSTKSVYSWSTYKHGSSSTQLKKYCPTSIHGWPDNKKTLEAIDDAACAIWGGNWRMPTEAEWTELRTRCTWTWTTYSGVSGYNVMGPNGNTIFLPAAGTAASGAGIYGEYWSSTLYYNISYPDFADGTYFSISSIEGSNFRRPNGLSVRPVCSTTNNYVLTIYVNECASPNIFYCVDGDLVSITAETSSLDMRFVQWSDGNTENPRVVTVTGDVTYTAQFAPNRLEIPVTADQWHYIAFPVDVDGADIEYAGNGTWGYYDGDRRATGVSGWQSVDPEVTPLNANQGYIFYGDQTGTLYVNIDPATLPSGDQSITLTDYPSFHPDNENWNFVGNPYNETYNVSHIAPNGMNLYIWNGTGYYAKTAGHDSYYLRPLEAFFVQKKNTENSVNFAAASAGAAAPARVLAANNNRYVDIAAVAGGYTDYTRVVLNETASMDYTVGYDLAKFFSSEAPIQLFTLDAQSIECGVQELPNGVEEIALGYTVLASGEVVISTTDMEETYYLYDAGTGITTDLRQSSYTFTAEAGTTVNRLSLRRAPGTATGVDGVNKYVNTPTKVVREGHVLILRGEKMYDLRGQEVQ